MTVDKKIDMEYLKYTHSISKEICLKKNINVKFCKNVDKTFTHKENVCFIFLQPIHPPDLKKMGFFQL